MPEQSNVKESFECKAEKTALDSNRPVLFSFEWASKFFREPGKYTIICGLGNYIFFSSFPGYFDLSQIWKTLSQAEGSHWMFETRRMESYLLKRFPSVKYVYVNGITCMCNMRGTRSRPNLFCVTSFLFSSNLWLQNVTFPSGTNLRTSVLMARDIG